MLKDGQAGTSLYETNSVDDTLVSSEQADKYKDSPSFNKRLTAGTFFIKMNQKISRNLKIRI